MNNIKVKILKHNFDGTPLFLAKLTQRGSEINSLEDLVNLYNDNINRQPSKQFMKLPHSTIFRMCNLTIAIYGLSTKAVSQLRTHATRLTFVSTSTQYSEFTKLDLPYVIPPDLSEDKTKHYTKALKDIHQAYNTLYNEGVDKDRAGYLLPQSLRKCLIIHGNYPSWQYMLQTRLCNRNTTEVQHICELILDAISKECGSYWADLCLPNCLQGGCKEGKFCCGQIYKDKRSNDENKTN